MTRQSTDSWTDLADRPRPCAMSSWRTMEVGDFLRELDFEQYEALPRQPDRHPGAAKLTAEDLRTLAHVRSATDGAA